MKKDLSLNWCAFYIFCRVPITIIAYIYWIFIKNNFDPISILYVMFLILLFIFAKSKTKTGYILIIISIILDVILMSINTYWKYGTTIIEFIFVFSVFFIIWFIPNYEYFRKRKQYFNIDNIFNSKFNNKISRNNDIENKYDKYEELRKLKELFDDEIITKEEFEKEKKKILK